MAESRRGVLFVCLGNICRSPLGEGVFRHIVNEAGLSANFKIDSCGTGDWHCGEPADARSIAVAKKHGVDISDLRARQIEQKDFNEFEVIVCMDDSNYSNVMNLKPKTSKSKVIKFMQLLPDNSYKIVPDPWYDATEQLFQTVYDLMKEGCPVLLKNIIANNL